MDTFHDESVKLTLIVSAVGSAQGGGIYSEDILGTSIWDQFSLNRMGVIT